MIVLYAYFENTLAHMTLVAAFWYFFVCAFFYVFIYFYLYFTLSGFCVYYTVCSCCERVLNWADAKVIETFFKWILKLSVSYVPYVDAKCLSNIGDRKRQKKRGNKQNDVAVINVYINLINENSKANRIENAKIHWNVNAEPREKMTEINVNREWE